MGAACVAQRWHVVCPVMLIGVGNHTKLVHTRCVCACAPILHAAGATRHPHMVMLCVPHDFIGAGRSGGGVLVEVRDMCRPQSLAVGRVPK